LRTEALRECKGTGGGIGGRDLLPVRRLRRWQYLPWIALLMVHGRMLADECRFTSQGPLQPTARIEGKRYRRLRREDLDDGLTAIPICLDGKSNRPHDESRPPCARIQLASTLQSK
jgi:hypothetical protein